VTYATSSLAAGTFHATITVNGGAAGTKQVAVTLTVLTTPALGCSTTQLSPSVTQGGNAASQGFSCSNGGAGSLNYTVSDDAPWLSVAPTSGSLTGGGPAQAFTVTYATSSLAAGTFQATITVNGGAAGTKQIAVKLTVVAAPILSCPTTHLTPSVTQGGNATSQGFSCSNTGGGSLDFSASDDAPWLSVAPTSGSLAGGGPAQAFTVTYATSSLAAGTFQGTITVSGGAAGTKQIAVTLTVVAAPKLSCPTTHLSPSVTQGGNAASQGFSCSNTGGGSLNYSVSDDAPWLSVAPTSGSLAGGGPAQGFTVMYATSSLVPGTYQATIHLNGGAAGTADVGVTLQVQLPPLGCSRTAISSGVVQGQQASDRIFRCSNNVTGSLDYTVDIAFDEQVPDWLSVSPAAGSLQAGSKPQAFTVSYDTGSLPLGLHTATIHVHGPGSTWDIAVALMVQFKLAAGQILVTDANHARVLQVDPGTGAVADFSPRAGSGANELVKPAGIAIDQDHQLVFLVDAAAPGHLVKIDLFGRQTVVDDPATAMPVDVGQEPFGVEWFFSLFVVADGSYSIVDPVAGSPTGGHSDPLLAHATGVAVLDGTDLAVATPGGLVLVPGGVFGFHAPFRVGPVQVVSDVTSAWLAATDPTFFTVQPLDCATSSDGAVQRWDRTGDPTPVASGDLLRCPISIGLLTDPLRLFVGDAATPQGGEARVVEVSANGAQSLVANLPAPVSAAGVAAASSAMDTWPAGLVVVPIDLVPEPEAPALALGCAAALAAIARRRARRA
jgi:hypothetical protein